jgi:hypothetical protein
MGSIQLFFQMSLNLASFESLIFFDENPEGNFFHPQVVKKSMPEGPNLVKPTAEIGESTEKDIEPGSQPLGQALCWSQAVSKMAAPCARHFLYKTSKLRVDHGSPTIGLMIF